MRVFWQTEAVLFVGRAAHASRHNHHAMQIVVARGDGALSVEANGDRVTAGALAIPSQLSHELWAPDSDLALLLIEPTSIVGTAVAARWGAAAVTCLPAQPWQELAEAAWTQACNDPAKVVQRMLDAASLLPTPVASTIDPRVQTMLTQIRECIDAPLAQLAHSVALSPSRARRLFRQHVGMPIRSYRLWARLRVSVEQLVVTNSVTEAAHAAGFADSAHLSRTFRRTLGVSPGAFVAVQGEAVEVAQ